MVCVVQTYDPPHPTLPLILDVTTGDDGGTNRTSHTVALPTGIAASQRLIAIFATRSSGDTSWPVGWTEILDANVGADTAMVAAYRDCDGTEGASITVTTGASRACAWQVWRLSAGNFIAGVAPEVGTLAGSNDANPNPPSLSPSWGAQNTLWIAATTVKDVASPPTVSGYPTNYSTNQTAVGGVANNFGVGAAARILNASSEDPGTFTLSGAEKWCANTIAIRIAA